MRQFLILLNLLHHQPHHQPDILTCDPDVVGRDLLGPAVHPAVPGPGVPGLQAGDGEGVGGRVQPDPGRVDEGRGPQLWSVHRHPGVLDGGERGAGPSEDNKI